MIKIFDAEQFEVPTGLQSMDAATVAQSQAIVDAVRAGGAEAVRGYAEQFGERTLEEGLLISRMEMEAAADRVSPADRALLERVANRIASFAEAQANSLTAMAVDVPGGRAGHTIEPIANVGCYAPAGRFSLPSTVLMTAVTARVAGCKNIVVASPNPSDIILTAALIAGADQVLGVGGAQAIAAMAYGFDGMERRDLIAGPGNRWVTAAKKIVSGDCGIDMLAGPSELALISDGSSDPATIAADLLAQAEHDADARPYLLVTREVSIDVIILEIERQLAALPTAESARQSLADNGAIIVCDDLDQAVDVCNRIAPEHLELHVRDPESLAARIDNAGCVFFGHGSAEVFGDYGVGPNHTLPTSGTARYTAGLNVFTFLRIRTWLNLDAPPLSLIQDTARLAEIEGLVGHQRAAQRRS